MQQLANGDLLRPLYIECWDYDRTGQHDFIGRCEASIADMLVRYGHPTSGSLDGGTTRVRVSEGCSPVPQPAVLDST